MNIRDYFKRLLDSFREHEATARPFTLPDARGLSRRSFLGLFAASTAAVATLDFDQLLWTPGEKTIFLPPAVQTVEVTLEALGPFGQINMDWVTREALRVLNNELSFAKNINRQYAGLHGSQGQRLGDSVNIRLPQKFTGGKRAGKARDRVKAVQLNQQFTVELDPADIRACKSDEEIRERVITPAAAVIARAVQRKKLTVFGELELPHGVEQATVARAPALGLSLRGTKHYDIADDRDRIRLDILGGKG